MGPVVPRLVNSIGRRLPRGWGDLVLQLALFLLAYNAYQAVRGIADTKTAAAFANADRVIHLEKSLGAFFEPGFQHALLNQAWLIDFASWMYLNSHYLVTFTFLAWLYLCRNDHFRFVRNMFLVAMGLALVGYALFPTAPPRLAAEGIVDTVSANTAVHLNGHASLLFNPYAAVPSMHIAFSLMVAIPGIALCRSIFMRTWWCLYPLLVFFVVVVTGNHYWFDAAAGAVVACMAMLAARQLARLRPESWAWREAPSEATA
jgi:hypothetical protein